MNIRRKGQYIYIGPFLYVYGVTHMSNIVSDKKAYITSRKGVYIILYGLLGPISEIGPKSGGHMGSISKCPFVIFLNT